MMRTATTSVNSALARARKVIAQRVPARSQQQALRTIDDAGLRRIVTEFATALETGDADRLVALLTRDVTWSMPPLPHWYRGIDMVTEFALRVPLTGCGSWRHVPTGANGQPAVACYLWDEATGRHMPWAVNVLTIRGEKIADVTSFIGAEHFARLRLPDSLP